MSNTKRKKQGQQKADRRIIPGEGDLDRGNAHVDKYRRDDSQKPEDEREQEDPHPGRKK